MDLSIIIVNYEAWPDTVCLVQRIQQLSNRLDQSVEIIVVDNGSQTHPLAKYCEEGAGVTYIRAESNRGFAAGVNLGWRASHGEYLLVMNPDLVLLPTFLDGVNRWINQLRQEVCRQIGVVGFRLYSPNGVPQHSTGFFPTLWWTVLGLLFPRERRKYRLGPRRVGQVDWVSGACFMVRRSVFETLHGLDERFFLYYEEVDFCWRAWKQKWQVVHDPQVGVIHLRPLEQRTVAPKLRVVLRHSLLHYFQKNLPYWQFMVMAVGVSIQAWAAYCLCGLISKMNGSRWIWRSILNITREMIRRRNRSNHIGNPSKDSLWDTILADEAQQVL